MLPPLYCVSVCWALPPSWAGLVTRQLQWVQVLYNKCRIVASRPSQFHFYHINSVTIPRGHLPSEHRITTHVPQWTVVEGSLDVRTSSSPQDDMRCPMVLRRAAFTRPIIQTLDLTPPPSPPPGGPTEVELSCDLTSKEKLIEFLFSLHWLGSAILQRPKMCFRCRSTLC